MDEKVEFLTKMFQDRDWFHSVGYEQYGRVVVYVKYMCHETLYDIPDTCLGKQVLCHFSASLLATREQFVETPPKFTPSAFAQAAKEAQAKGIDTGFGQAMDDIEELDSSVLEVDLSHLQEELTRLEKLCGTSTLADIFFEIQDGKNAVTDLSNKYPEVRQRLEVLFDEYGFDVLYEELEL